MKPMKVGFGKHKDKSVATIVLKEPGYVAWVLSESRPSGPLARVKAEAQRLIAFFDSKPYQRRCHGHGCTKSATYCTVYRNNVYGPMWWCDDCNPYQMGATDGKLSGIRTYNDAINHCNVFCTRRDALKDLVKIMAHAKGLPKRVGEKQAAEFFAA